jgi:hypothetical protein
MRWAAEKAGQRMRGGQTDGCIQDTRHEGSDIRGWRHVLYRGVLLKSAQFVMTGERIKTNSRVPGSLCETRIHPCQHQKGVVVVWR